MKPSQDSEASSSRRRTLKHHVERRRRERINRSLDKLKSLLVPPQEAAQRRVEKAEILEHTVLFLQNTRAPERSGAAAGAHKDSFQDGFSDCLDRAARFLGAEGKGLQLRAALQPSVSAAASGPDSAPAGRKKTSDVRSSSSSSSSSASSSTASASQLLRTSCRSILHLWLPEPGSVPGLLVFRCVQKPGQSQGGVPSQQMRGGANKQNPLQGPAAGHPLWRPWP